MKKQKKQALGLAVDEQGDCRPQEERRTGETTEQRPLLGKLGKTIGKALVLVAKIKQNVANDDINWMANNSRANTRHVRARVPRQDRLLLVGVVAIQRVIDTNVNGNPYH